MCYQHPIIARASAIPVTAERPVQAAQARDSSQTGTPGKHPVEVSDTRKWEVEASAGINLGFFHLSFKGLYGRSHTESQVVLRPDPAPAVDPVVVAESQQIRARERAATIEVPAEILAIRY